MKRFFYIISLLFFVLILFNIFEIEKYVKLTEKNQSIFLKSEIDALIDTKKSETLALAITLVKNPKFLYLYKKKQFDEIVKLADATLPKLFKFKHIWIHFIDSNGNNIYNSWTNKLKQGTNILNFRKDLKKVINEKKIFSTVSVGRFDLTIKCIVPVFDEKHKLIGIFEVISHFNSIVEHLQNRQNIQAAVIIDKRYTKQLKYPFSNLFIDGYNIANINIRDNFKNILYEKGVSFFINNTTIKYINDPGNFLNGYFTICKKISDDNGRTLGYFVLLIKDTDKLGVLEFGIYIVFILMILSYLVIGYLLDKEMLKNKKLINSLDKKVQEQSDKNLLLTYKDSITPAYKKEMFELDLKKSASKYVIIMNIKSFSRINSIYGFEAGDRLLELIAYESMKILDKKLYRLDSDEFVFFSNDYKYDISLINEFFKRKSLEIDKINIKIRVSFRFGITKKDSKNLYQELILALQESKKSIYKNYYFFKTDKEFIQKQKLYAKFNNIVYDALYSHNEAEIVPYFQPIVDNETKNIVKYEALARLRFDRNVYAPYYFMDIVKNGGFSYDMTRIMIEKSLKKMEGSNIKISINITEDDLLTYRLLNDLQHLSKQFGINHKNITLEVLEGITNTGAKNNIEQLVKLKNKGFKIAIDDFGVEYSNFERIAELDIDFIKIDGKYIRDILTNEKNEIIVKTIIDFADKLGIQTVAEFVEDEKIYKKVKSLGIRFSQGYYFGKPVADIKE